MGQKMLDVGRKPPRIVYYMTNLIINKDGSRVDNQKNKMMRDMVGINLIPINFLLYFFNFAPNL